MSGIGLNGALWLGYSGLSTAQQQINTTGRNLANVDTPGASRQQVAVTEDISVDIGGKNVSTGVYALGITGTRSQYLDTLVQTENGNLGAATASSDMMALIQNALQEALSSTQTDGTATSSQTGVSAATTALFNAWSQLSADPTDSSLRDAVSSAALSFSTTAQSVYNQLLQAKQSGFTDAGSAVSTANSLITQIAKLNQQIASAEADSQSTSGVPVNQASDMRDQREQLIEQLSSIVNIKVTQDSTNPSMVDIQLADTSSGTSQLATGTAPTLPATGTLTINGTDLDIASGDDLDAIAAKINASVSNVTATVSNGNLVLDSLSTITATGTSSLAAALSVAQTPSASAPITLVKGSSGGGQTYTGAADASTYSLTVGGSAENVNGYGADKSLFILAQNGTTGTISAGPTGGTLGGLTAVDKSLGFEDQSGFASGQTILDRFNTFINNVATTVNGLVATGYDLDGNAASSNPPFVVTSSSAPTSWTAGTVVINGTSVNVSSSDSLSQIVDNINAANTGATATLANGKITLTSTSTFTVAGTSSIAGLLTATPTSQGGNFFYDNASGSATTGAWNLGVNSVYDYTNADYNSDYIPAAETAVSNGQSNDGSLADDIGNQVDDTAIYPFYTTLVSDIGQSTQAANTNLSSQQLVSSQAVNSQQSYSGISSDEEMTDLVQFQQAFQANSRFINTISQMYTVLQSMGT